MSKLVLTRRPGEEIMIGDDIVVTVLEIRGEQVRISIDAPRDVAVHREEVYDRIQLEKQGGSSPEEAGSSKENNGRGRE